MLEQDLKIVIEQDPKHADALNALGYTLADQTGRYQEALGYIQRALVLKPDSPAILDSMGWVQYRLGHPREALPYLKRAMELLPDAEIAAHLGEVLWAIGEQERARRIWREALNKDPGSEYILKMQERYGVRF
jgi:tetratricopeptide (TPR) repeat protein